MTTASDRIREFFEELAIDAVEERVVEYTIREVQNGRRLQDVLDDPYVRNRLNEEKIAGVFENPEVMEALEATINETFKGGRLDIL